MVVQNLNTIGTGIIQYMSIGRGSSGGAVSEFANSTGGHEECAEVILKDLTLVVETVRLSFLWDSVSVDDPIFFHHGFLGEILGLVLRARANLLARSTTNGFKEKIQ